MMASKEDVAAIMYADFSKVMILKDSLLKTLNSGAELSKMYKMSIRLTILSILLFFGVGYMQSRLNFWAIIASIGIATNIVKLFGVIRRLLDINSIIRGRKELLFLIAVRESEELCK